MDNKMNALISRGTWELIYASTDDVVGCRWVYTLKYGPNGSVDWYKAKFVAKSYTQDLYRELLWDFSLIAIVLNIGRYTDISIKIWVFYPKRYDKCKILPDIILNRYGPIYRHVGDISADICDENIRYIATWHIWGASTNTSEKFLQKVSIFYKFDPKLDLSSFIWFI